MHPKTSTLAVIALALALAALAAMPCMAQDKLGTGEVKTIAQEAYIYALPMVMAYGIMYG